MADHFTLFSGEITNLKPIEHSWIKRWLETNEHESFDNELEVRSFWFYSMGYGDLVALADFLQEFIAVHRPDKEITVEFAQTCSRPRLGEFGGGSFHITKDRQLWFSTSSWPGKPKIMATIHNPAEGVPKAIIFDTEIQSVAEYGMMLLEIDDYHLSLYYGGASDA